MLKVLVLFFGFTALFQTITAQSCSDINCRPNGNCEIQNNLPVCVCNSGFVGSRCQLSDPCTRRPCGLNGACFPVVTSTTNGQELVSHHCQCYSGFFGPNCENVPNRPCTSNPCANNGICVNKDNTWDYSCICVGPYTGKTCATYVDLCSHHNCKNDALCIPSTENNNYTCSCKNGFYGPLCEIEINECEITDSATGLVTSPCQNNATCFDLVDAYYCECRGPYFGQNCATWTGNDLNSLLLPVILPAVVSAALLPILPSALALLYLNNRNKGEDVNPCNSNPCDAGSICIPNGDGYVCQCRDGFFGNPCQPNPCLSNPCRQPGSQCIPVEAGGLITNIPGCTCVNPTATYVCVCPSTSPAFASTIC